MPDADRPLLIYDGDCGFCRGWIARWRRRTGDAVDYAPYQTAAALHPEIEPEAFRRSVVWIEPGGRVCFAAEAVFRALAWPGGRGVGLAAYERVPGFAGASEAAYRLVARHRGAFSALTRLLWGDPAAADSGHAVAANLFRCAMALVFLAAFASLGAQITGLVGERGILPVKAYLAAVARAYGPARFWDCPTLCWLDASDAFLRLQCWAGCAAALALLAGVAPVAMAALLTFLYLSVSTAGQEFLWFQWDSLLVEAGFLTIFLVPWRLWSPPGRDRSPPAGPLWMLRWLLFRLMFCSAVVKLASGDPAWRSLTALRYHFETQPLPPWTAWYAHHLPAWSHTIEAAAMFAIEGLAPFLIFLPRRARILGALLIGGFQALILITGNYGIFNLLSIALCLLLIDDAAWPARLRRRWGESLDANAPPGGRWPAWIARPALACLFVITLVPLAGSFRRPAGWLAPLRAVYEGIAPWRLVNAYGLFAVMTTSRPEIVIEGSEDGVAWKPYAFRYKPGDVDRRPAFVTPHMPRLDWQMWFAALNPRGVEPWFLGLCTRLLQGSPPVLDLLGPNPFPREPPRYVRALLYDYQFTDEATRRGTGAWWVRSPLGEYAPALTLIGGRLSRANLPPSPPSR